MQRNMELVRSILLTIEAAPAPVSQLDSLLKEDRSPEARDQLVYTMQMLVDQAGLVTGIKAHTYNGKNWINLQLTWSGHEFLESVRDPEVWAKTKEGAKKAGNFGLSFIFDLAKAYGKHIAKERLGIEI